MAVITKANVAPTVEQKVAMLVQKELKERTVLRGVVKDMSSQVTEGMDRVDIPRTGSFTAEDVVEDTALTGQALVFATDQLDLDQHKAILVRVPDKTRIQSKVALIQEIVKRQGTEMARKMDEYIYTQVLASAAGLNVQYTGGATDTITKADILKAKRVLESKFAEKTRRFLLVNYTQEAALLAIDDFIHADKYGTADSLITGELGRIYGIRVIATDVVGTGGNDESVLVQEEAVVFATQMALKFEKDRNIEFQEDRYASSALWGAVAQNPGNFAVTISTAVDAGV